MITKTFRTVSIPVFVLVSALLEVGCGSSETSGAQAAGGDFVVLGAGGQLSTGVGGMGTLSGGMASTQPNQGGQVSAGGSANAGSNSIAGGQVNNGGKPGRGGSMSTGGQASASGCSTSVAYANQVQPIFNSNCSSAGCHSGTHPAGNLNLTSTISYSALVNVASSCSGRLLVKPGDVAQSYLVDKLLGQNLCSGTQMPKAGTSISAADLSLIEGWICEGAPNN